VSGVKGAPFDSHIPDGKILDPAFLEKGIKITSTGD
jgi:hypothetical protein